MKFRSPELQRLVGLDQGYGREPGPAEHQAWCALLWLGNMASLPPGSHRLYDRNLRLTDCEPRARGNVGMEDQLARLGIHVRGGLDADPEEIAEATLQLRRELLDLDVGAVEVPRAGEAPAGTRAVELAALGGLVVSMAKPELLGAVVAAVRSWLSRSQRRSIKLALGDDVLELTGVSSAEQRRLTDEWLRRHDGR